jgi:hypothetical protein
VTMSTRVVIPRASAPLGATVRRSGVNFNVFTKGAVLGSRSYATTRMPSGSQNSSPSKPRGAGSIGFSLALEGSTGRVLQVE